MNEEKRMVITQMLLGGFWLIILATTLFSILYLLFSLVLAAEDRRAMAECYQWQHIANTTPAFYLTDAEQAQCDYHHIDVWNQ